MSITVITATTTRLLTSLEALGDEIGVTAVLEQEQLFTRLLAQASASVERYCGRIFAQQRYREILHMTWRQDILFLRQRPLQTVETITSDSVAMTDYRIENAEAGLLYRRYGWLVGAEVPEWTITYVAGYLLPGQAMPPALSAPPVPAGERLPQDIERATLEAMKVWFSERNPEQRIQARSFGEGQSVTYSVQAGHYGLPKLSQEMLCDGGWKLARVA